MKFKITQQGFLKLTKKTLISILIVLTVITGTGIIYLIHPGTADAAWFNDNWAYRQAITFTIQSNTSDLTSVDTPIIVDTSAISTKIQSSCQDLRFTDQNGSTLPYYIVSGCTTTTTRIYVKVNLVPKNTTSMTILMYYGNPSAVAASDITQFPLEQSILGFYPMNEASWNGTSGEVKDYSVSAANCTANNSATTTSTAKFGNAGGFGSTKYIDCGAIVSSFNNARQRTFSAWIYMTSTSTANQLIMGENLSGNTVDDILSVKANTQTIEAVFTNTATNADSITSTTVSLNTWTHVLATFDLDGDNKAHIYLNGTEASYGTQTAGGGTVVQDNSADHLLVGNTLNGLRPFNGNIDDARVYNAFFSATQASNLANANASVNTTNTFATEEKAPSPLLYWKFEVGQGSTTSDSSSNANTGNLGIGSTNPTWQTENQCISGKCLYFNGTNSKVTGTKVVKNVQTASFWVRPNTLASTNGLIDLDGGTHKITANSAGTLTATGFTSPTIYVNGVVAGTITNNQWNFVEVTTATGFDSSSSFTVGVDAASNYTKGFFDEVKFYNYARSNAQVLTDYNSRGAGKGAGSTSGGPPPSNSTALSKGLVGYYQMDENTWNATSGEVLDSSGNSNNGTGNNKGFAHIQSKSGSGTGVNSASATFDSATTVNNMVVVGIRISGSRTISSVTDNASPANTYNFVSGIAGATSNARQYYGTQTNPATQITVTFTGATADITVNLDEFSGNGSSRLGDESWNGATSTSLTVNTITTNAGSLVVGTGALDTAGTITAGTSYTLGAKPADPATSANVYRLSSSTSETAPITTDTSSLWQEDAGEYTDMDQGKFGNSGHFDGINDYVDATNGTTVQVTGALTLSAWVKGVATGSTRDIIAKNGNSSNLGYKLYLDSNSKLNMDISGDGTTVKTATGTTALTSTSTWYHVTGVYIPGQSVTVFVNAVQEGQNTTSIPSSINNTSTNLNFGAENTGASNYFFGSIDEIRVYNRALLQSEISSLYNFAPGPIAYWKFDEPSWSGTTNEINDSSGKGINCTANAGATTTIGKFGKAGNFTGSTTKRADCGTILASNIVASNKFTLESWVYLKSTTATNMYILIGSRSDTSIAFGVRVASGTQHLLAILTGVTSATTTTDIPLNTWTHIAVTADPTGDGKIHIYFNGIEASYSAQGSVLGNISRRSGLTVSANAESELMLGNSISGSLNGFNGALDEEKVYNYVRTPGQIIEDMNAGHPAPGSPVGTPVGYWKFNEGYGLTTASAHNSGNCGSACDGTITGITQGASSGWTDSGKFGRALNFDGTDDYVAMPSDLSQFKVTSDITLSAWINLTNTSSTHDIICKYTGTASTSSYCLYTDTNGKLNMSVVDSTGPTIITTTGNTTLSTSTWYHVVGVFNNAGAGNSVTLYVNGVQDKQNTTSIPTTLQNPSTVMDIGAENAGSNPFIGTIDEPKFYAQALTPAQVLIDMNRSQAEVMGATSDNSSYQKQAANQEYCVPGDSTSCAAPVGRWDFEEGTGTTANDTSGNAITGTLVVGGSGNQTTSGQAWQPGKFGKTLNFDGTDDDVTFASTISGVKTIGFWVYPVTTTQSFIDLDGGTHYISASSGTVSATGFTSPTIYVNGVSAAAITANTWNFIEVTTGTNFNTTSSMTFGKANGSWLKGKIDGVRIYNYVRTNAQANWDYNQGKPVGYWKMDECQGTTINDSSGKSYTGTLTVGSGGTQTTPGTCTTNAVTPWFNGVTGKYNASVNFDGTDDYVDISTGIPTAIGTGNFSISFWFKTTANTKYLFALNDAPSTNDVYFDIGASGKLFLDMSSNDSFTIQSAGSTLAYNDGTWHHGVATFSTTNGMVVYTDGKQVGTNTSNTRGSTLSATARIATDSFGDAPFSGQLDDARVYNYALTATQVKTLYNNGALNYGPVTGIP